MEEVRIDKIVHGGQGLGTLHDGRKIFVWNALPGETVKARIIKKKRNFVEAIAEEIVVASPERVAPEEENYLATSPWQMMTFDAENAYKSAIVRELFSHENVTVPDFGEAIHTDSQWGYRNKMEYSFWGDDDGIHLALYRRGSHGKQIVEGSKLALLAIDRAANAILDVLNNRGTRAGDLKTIIVRSNQAGEAVAALFVKPKTFDSFDVPAELKGMRIYYSNPKSPASVPTKLLHELGDIRLQDTLHNESFAYDVDSFFQVNIPVFEQALTSIKSHVSEPAVVDMYAGVGSIGLSVAAAHADLIELDPATAHMARINAEAHSTQARVIEASTEKVLECITPDKPVIFDPPRAGLHDKVVERVLEVLPEKVIYLSCNPATHARDLAKLQSSYTVTHFEVYNFFPRTPHIETLAILIKK